MDATESDAREDGTREGDSPEGNQQESNSQGAGSERPTPKNAIQRGANSGAVARRVGVDVEGLGQPGWIGTPHSPSCMNGRTDGYYMSELF